MTRERSLHRCAPLLLAGLAACGTIDILPAPAAGTAGDAVTTFNHLADSVARAGGDTDAVNAFYAIAEAVRLGGRVSLIDITVDGAPKRFYATAQQTELPALVNTCLAGAACPPIPPMLPLRTLLAWEAANPRHVLQVASASDADSIRAYLFPTLVPFAGSSASLVYMDGAGGSWFGSTGTQGVAMQRSNVACTPAAASPPRSAILPAVTCEEATFTVSLNATAQPSSFLAPHNTATGTHTFVLPAQPVLGALFRISSTMLPQPPITLPVVTVLPATLDVQVDNTLVTMALTISNNGPAPVTIEFSNGQAFDFIVTDAVSGAKVWQWSDGIAFTASYSSRTIPAHTSIVYTAAWKPTRKGSMRVNGLLTSRAHRAASSATFVVP